MDIDIKYINENYVELNDVCEKSGITFQKLEELISKELIPSHSYEIEYETTIKSSLDDHKNIKSTQKFFPKNVIQLIKENINIENPIEFKNKINEEFTETFVNSKDNQYAYGNILNADKSVEVSKLNIEFEKEWKYYLKGIYGICTLNATGEEIAKKEIAVKQLMDFIAKHKDGKLTENEKETLIILNNKYNEVSNLFAPYQRESSSRGKYLDSILKINKLESKIKGYN